MQIIIPIVLIGFGLVAIFYLRTKTQNSTTEIKFMQTKKISELKDMFAQMDANGLGNDYREFVELKGNIVSDNLVETPFSNRKVAYCESELAQVTESREQYRVNNGNMQTRVNKQEKWQKVMFEASKQCERAKIPTCFAPTTFEEILQKDFDKIIVLAERSTEKSLKQYLNEHPTKKGERILAIIGPEGGFSQKEFDYFRSKNLPLISLGDLILKAETAVIVTLGDIVYEYQG